METTLGASVMPWQRGLTAYRAVNTVRTVALDKTPGVRPIGVGESWMQLWSDCSHTKMKVAATNACGNNQLCAGLRSGIEANLHVVQAIWPQSAGWTEDSGVEEEEEDGNPQVTATLRCVRAEGLLDPNVYPGAAEDDRHSRYEAGTGFGSALFDARNGFNELNRYLMLWNVAHLWNQGSRSAFNCYRHWVCCLVRTEPGHPPLVIHSQEGITQGDCLARSLYGVALMPLVSRMREMIPEALQPWYCDNAGAAGKALPNARCLDFLVKFGPQYGYFSLSPANPTTFARPRMRTLPAKPLKALALTSTTREGSATSAASLGALRRRRSGWSGWWRSGWLRW